MAQFIGDRTMAGGRRRGRTPRRAEPRSAPPWSDAV